MIAPGIAAALLLAIVWPLLLAGAIAFNATRGAALKLAPWAALPALLASAVPVDTGLPLPGVLMNSALVLDSVGRVFLVLSAGLWLITGLLARPDLTTRDGNRYGVLMLLAMAGSVAIPLAADAVLFFAAGTIAAYALYGLLVHKGDVGAVDSGRILVVLLVLSDLVIFELLLVLSQACGGVDFPSMRQGFADAERRGLMLLLLVVGFGTKTGLIGFHYWLAPVFASSRPALRPALIGFVFGAGLLGWLRLLPGGELHWPAAGTALQTLAWVMLGYAAIVGLLQAHSRSALAYAVMALAGLWLAVLGFALLQPQAWHAVEKSLQATVVPMGLAFAALLVLDRDSALRLPVFPAPWSTGLGWLAISTVAVAAAGVAVSLGRLDTKAGIQASLAAAAIVVLAARSLWLPDPSAGSGTQPSRLTARRPTIPPGDLVVPLGRWLAIARDRGERFAMVQLPAWRDACVNSLSYAWSKLELWPVLDRLESGLRRWRNVLEILLLLGLVAAWLAATG